jgi:DNA-binding IscR family transcriptional regulator
VFKETRGLEYTLEVLRAFHRCPGSHDSKKIYELIESGRRVTASLTYVQKILPRMTKINLLSSSEKGYALARPIDEITVAQVLNICDMPDPLSPLYSLCTQLKQAVTLTGIDEFYDFSH